MKPTNTKCFISIIFLLLILNACKSLPGGDALKNPPDPRERVAKNLEEGKGFRLSNATKNLGKTSYEFASSNELWRASLDTIDFIPLASVNYSGGIIITDWYSANDGANEQLKISIRFLTNEIRSDAISIKVFTKKCDLENKCKITEESENLVKELTREILKKATLYEKENPDKKIKPYVLSTPGE